MKLFTNIVVGFSFCSYLLFFLVFPAEAYQLPPSVTLPSSDMVVSKNNIIAVPYIMNDWENCNPRTLKRGTDGTTDCWSHLTSQTPLPPNRPEFAVGAFGSHVAFSWNELHLGPNQYDWRKLDDYLRIAVSQQIRDSQGNQVPFKPVAIAFSEYLQTDSNPHDGKKDFISYIPDFIQAELPADQLTINLLNCDVQDMVPYHNPIFQARYKEFIEAALDHIRQSPHGYVVQAYVMSGGLSHETTPTKNLSDCQYGTYYRERYTSGYIQFIKDSLVWTNQALRQSGRLDVPAFLQSAAGRPEERLEYFRTAHPFQIGFKMNSLAPSNANGINARPFAVGLYDALAMTELTWPKGFEPVFPVTGPTSERCASKYCYSNAKYQGLYWNYLTSLGYKADLVDFQKEYFIWLREMVEQFNLGWFHGLLQKSIGKTANQSTVAWNAFAERFNTEDSFPNPRPAPPLEVGVGDYYKAEFTERGDRDFYLYRLGEIEDSTLIRQQAGIFSQGQGNYALLQNSCYRSQTQLSGQATRILSGEELRSSGKLASSQFAHPFSAAALTTEGASGKTQVSLVLEDQVQSIKTNSTNITVEYLDAGTDQFALEFVNSQGQVVREVVTKTNTKLWKSHTITKSPSQITWQHRLPGGADLRLDCMCNSAAGDDIFSMVRIESQGPPLRVAPSNSLSFCNIQGGGGCTASPDFNGDGVVNLLDLSAVLSNLGAQGQSRYDVTCDSQVDLRDITLVIGRLTL